MSLARLKREAHYSRKANSDRSLFIQLNPWLPRPMCKFLCPAGQSFPLCDARCAQVQPPLNPSTIYSKKKIKIKLPQVNIQKKTKTFQLNPKHLPIWCTRKPKVTSAFGKNINKCTDSVWHKAKNKKENKIWRFSLRSIQHSTSFQRTMH